MRPVKFFYITLQLLFASGFCLPGMAQNAGATKSSSQSTAKVFNCHNWGFMENKGQLTSPEGESLTDISFYASQKGMNIYCRPGMISFVMTSASLKEDHSVSEATGDNPKLRALKQRQLMEDMANTQVSASRVDLVLQGANANAVIAGSEVQDYYENFYTHDNSLGGISHARSFETVSYKDIYPGIDLVLHTLNAAKSGTGHIAVKYEFVVHPGANPGTIKMHWNGAGSLAMIENGGLQYSMGAGMISEAAPVSFDQNGTHVSSSFVINGNAIAFKTGKYDHSKTLTIDPLVSWSSFMGGSSTEWGQAIITDASGYVYVTGPTLSSAGIATSGAYQTSYAGGNDAFLSQFSPTGALKWCTYIGGTGYDDGWSLAMDVKTNYVYMVGTTSSSSGLATTGAYQTSFGGTYDSYLTRFSPTGSLAWCTYFGSSGNDQGLYIASDTGGNVIMCSWTTSSSGIATSGVYQTSLGGGLDVAITKYNSAGKLLWSTYYGGSGDETVYTIATDTKGDAIVTGSTVSSSGVATSGAYQTSYGGSTDAFIASFTPNGGINWGTYYGGSGNDYGYDAYADAKGNIIVTGQSASSSGISTAGSWQQSFGGGVDGYVAKFSSGGVRQWGTYLGQSGNDNGWNAYTDPTGNIYIAGSTTSSTGMTTSAAYQGSYGGGGDAFYSKFFQTGSRMHGTFFGGSGSDIGYAIAVDKNRNVFFTGSTTSTSGIATSGAYQTSNGGGQDVFVTEYANKRYQTDAGVTFVQTPISAFCAGTKAVKVQIANFGSKDLTSVSIGWMVNKKVQTSYSWTGTLKTDSFTTVTLGNYAFTAGMDTIVAWTTKPNAGADSLTENDTAKWIDTVNAFPKPNAGGKKSVCIGASIGIGSTAVSGHTYSWTSKPSGFTSTLSAPIVSPTVTTTYYVTETVTSGGCSAVDSVTVAANTAPTPNAGGAHTICYGGSVSLGTTAITGHTYVWSSVPSGFSSTLSNPTVKPTEKTTYYITEIDTATGCYGYDQATVTVNPPGKASGGGDHTICLGGSVTLGAASVSGHSYSWKSKPAGFTSTLSNPPASPTVTTFYYLTDVITATGCTSIDSAIITVNPVPAPNTGTGKTICSGGTTTIGGSAVSGHAYSWASKPSGFTSTLSNPSVSPSGTTTYYLTETFKVTGCSKTDSVVIKTNPLPDAKTGGNGSICLGDSKQIGDISQTGHTYSWTSRPAGFTSGNSNPTVNPAATTTYILTETITATGCLKTDSAVITVNTVKPVTGGSKTICSGSAVTIGGVPNSDHIYSWTSNPAGFTSTASNPQVSPKTTTVYYLTEGSVTTGCSSTDSIAVKVNPVPAAKTIASKNMCLGSTVSIGAAPATGSTYVWTSKPAGYSSTDADPSASPTVTTWYYLTETITATGCTAKDSVKLTVLPLPDSRFTVDYAGNITYLHAADSSGNDAKYQWTLGDGDTAHGHLAMHLYPKNKPFKISLSYTGANGCTSHTDSTVNIQYSYIGNTDEKPVKLEIYPNPFRDATLIRYQLSEPALVQITLTDMSGKQIGKIAGSWQAAGTYQYELTAEKYHLAPGTYILKISTNDALVSRQIVKVE